MKPESRRAAVRRERRRRITKAGEFDVIGRCCALCDFTIGADEDIVYTPHGDLVKVADPNRTVFHTDCLAEAACLDDVDPAVQFAKVRGKMLAAIAG